MPSDGSILASSSTITRTSSHVHFEEPIKLDNTDTHNTDNTDKPKKLATIVPSPMLLLSLPSMSSSSLLPSITPRTAQLPASKLAASVVAPATSRPRIDRYHVGNIKPTFRGVLHELLTYVTLPYTAYLLYLSYPNPRLLLSSTVYCVCLFASLLSSALYHRVQWSTAAREELLRKLDHLAIFLVGAGGGTPFALLLLWDVHPVATVVLLVLLWVIPAIAAYRLFTRQCSELTTFDMMLHVLHPTLTAPFLLMAFRVLPVPLVSCVLTVWVLYAIAFTVFTTEKPVGWPMWFGYHEVFHVVISAAFVLSMYTHIQLVKGKQAGLF